MRVFAISALVLSLAGPAFASPSGKEIIQKVLDQPSPAQAKVEITMTLKGSSAGVRKLTSYVKKVNGKTRSVVKFQEPADYRGAGILVIEKEDGSMERKLRLNGQKRVRPLPAGSQSGAFLNTDFSYEDIDGRKDWKDDAHVLLREEPLRGQQCYVVETTPAEDAGSAYKRIVQWIRKDNYVPVQIEFFADGDKPAKRLVVDELKQIDGYWISTKSTMATLEKNTSTALEVNQTDFKSDIADLTFTDRFLLE
jgi:hypothetical protein